VASLYEAFPAPEAHRLAGRLEIHHTPKHGSWLNLPKGHPRRSSSACWFANVWDNGSPTLRRCGNR